MDFSTINWLGVIIAWFFSFVSAFMWFNEKTLFPVWWQAMKKPEGELPGAGLNMAVVFGTTIVTGIATAAFLSALIGTLGKATGGVSLGAGFTVGLTVGLILSLIALSHRLFGGQGVKVWLIEAGNDVLNLAVMGLILAIFQ